MKNPNSHRPPPRKTLQFRQGWGACEAGRSATDNPYRTDEGAYSEDWLTGFQARANIGFDVGHLPRKPSGAFA